MVSRGLHGLVAAVLLLQAGCAGFRTCNDAWWGPDKAKHFAAGFALAAGGTALAANELDPEAAAAGGGSAAMAAGLGKETYDLRVKDTCWSWQDVFWDFLGASAGASLAATLVD